jgi:hypothetical protein
MRNSNGTFAKGNRGGPGRPRRDVEYDYLVALSQGVKLADWKKIVKRASDDAKQGDWRAREWLSRYLLGLSPPRLFDAVAADAAGLSTDQRIGRRGQELNNHESMLGTMSI